MDHIRSRLSPQVITGTEKGGFPEVQLAHSYSPGSPDLPGLPGLSILRFTRGLALTRVVSSANRSMKALRFTIGRRDFGYVAALAGPAGMSFFERDVNPDLKNFGNTLWYTSVAITIGPDYCLTDLRAWSWPLCWTSSPLH